MTKNWAKLSPIGCTSGKQIKCNICAVTADLCMIKTNGCEVSRLKVSRLMERRQRPESVCRDSLTCRREDSGPPQPGHHQGKALTSHWPGHRPSSATLAGLCSHLLTGPRRGLCGQGLSGSPTPAACLRTRGASRTWEEDEKLPKDWYVPPAPSWAGVMPRIRQNQLLPTASSSPRASSWRADEPCGRTVGSVHTAPGDTCAPPP